MRIFLFLLLFVFSGCGSKEGAIGPLGVSGRYRATLYYIADEEHSSQGGPQTELRDRHGRVLAVVSQSFAKKINLQGSGRLVDGRVINVSQRVNGEMRYHFVRHRYGVGASGEMLVPFCSVAVDTSRIPFGTHLLIEETRGMRLPNGEIHDGVWIAADRGGKIKNDRIDLFVGKKEFAHALRDHGIRSMQALNVTHVNGGFPARCSQ